MENLLTLQKWIRESDNIVFFGGAGVSTETVQIVPIYGKQKRRLNNRLLLRF